MGENECVSFRVICTYVPCVCVGVYTCVRARVCVCAAACVEVILARTACLVFLSLHTV